MIERHHKFRAAWRMAGALPMAQRRAVRARLHALGSDPHGERKLHALHAQVQQSVGSIEAPESVGFIVTPGEIADRIAGMDRAIQALARDVQAHAAKLSPSWRAEFEKYLHRWQIERDSRESIEARLFATRVMPRLEEFEAGFRFWSADYRKKTGSAVSVPMPEKPETWTDLVTGGNSWIVPALLLGGGLLLLSGLRGGTK